ncbi:MAG: hypothetical protein ABWY81_10550 [Jiangellaceae bacterium]
MTTFEQKLAGRYVAAGGDRPDLHARCIARALFVRDIIRTLDNTDEKFGINPSDSDSLAKLVDTAEEHLEHTANDVSQRSVIASPNTGGYGA